MKKELNATDKVEMARLNAVVKAKSGDLVGFVYHDETRMPRLMICRWTNKSLEFADTIRADEIEDLARVTAALAEIMQEFAELGKELRDDLGCLGHCMSQMLGHKSASPIDELGLATKHPESVNMDRLERRKLTTEPENLVCECGGAFSILDSYESSETVQCKSCQRCQLLIRRAQFELTIPLADFHLKRGNVEWQRPIEDLSMATQLHDCLTQDMWPNSATIVDFGIESRSHLGALQHAVRSGCTAYDLDRVMGDGAAITQLACGIPGQPYVHIVFKTVYDNVDWTEESGF